MEPEPKPKKHQVRGLKIIGKCSSAYYAECHELSLNTLLIFGSRNPINSFIALTELWRPAVNYTVVELTLVASKSVATPAVDFAL